MKSKDVATPTRSSRLRRWIMRRLITAIVFALAGALVKRMTTTSRGNVMSAADRTRADR